MTSLILTYLPVLSYSYHVVVARSAVGSAAVPKVVDDVVTALYGSQYRSLFRLAVLLGGDVRAAEEITQSSFVALHGAWPRLRDRDAAVAFLRRSVVSRSRLLSRPDARPAEPDRPAEPAEPDRPGEGTDPRIMIAIRALPCRQREAVVLRLYLDLTERQAAAAMGITTGALRQHASRAMAALRPVL